MYKTRHAFTYLLLKESVANDVINVSLFAGLICVVNNAINEWRRRLSVCVVAEGGHFEHYLGLLLSK